MKSENEKVALQSVEFWSTICEEEYNLLQERETNPETICHKFAEQMSSKIVETLLYLLTKKVIWASGPCLFELILTHSSG